MSATTRNVLIMDFNSLSKTKSIRVTDPKEDLTAAQVEAAMNTLKDLNIFSNKEPLDSLKGARSVQTVTNKFDITID